MKTLTQWTASDLTESTYVGMIEFQDMAGEHHNFEVMQTTDRIIFGGACNVGFLESGFIRRVFSWLTRIGVGRKFGSLPISWYQMHQCAAIEHLEDLAPQAEGWRCKAGNIQARISGKWQTVTSSISAFQHADTMTRK